MFCITVCIRLDSKGMASTIDRCLSEVTQILIRQSDTSAEVRSSRTGRQTAYIHNYQQSSKQHQTHCSIYQTAYTDVCKTYRTITACTAQTSYGARPALPKLDGKVLCIVCFCCMFCMLRFNCVNYVLL
jgi:hypothetical protein